MSDNPYSAFPLRTINTPREVTKVKGCNCSGGGTMHLADVPGQVGCSIWDLPHEEMLANVEDAERRGQQYTESLNAQLRADPARARAEAAALEAHNRQGRR